MGRTTSRITMLHSNILDQSPAGKLTSQQLLKHCIDAQNNQPSLLKRSFRSLLGDTVDRAEGRDNTSIRIMQWNVLADALSKGADNFIKCPREALEWDTRRVSCLREILTYDPDVICLQEVDHFHDFFKVQLERVGYKGVFKAKPDSPCLDCLSNNGPDGCAVFYKLEKFSLVNSMCPVLEVKDGGSTWPTNQVAVLLRLKCKAVEDHHEKELVVGTTHLKAKASWHQLRHLQGLNLLEVLQQQAGGCPLILSGDFNAEPSENVYKAFEASKMGLDSVYKNLSEDCNSEPPYTTWKIRPSGEVCHTIDYMWYTQNQLCPVKILELPLGEHLGKDRLPSHTYPSDHLSLVADFAFKS
ncbi:nocturnin-like isoform X2 [Acanthaster planci]|nr:nocturnin-like isoform X2 [Acanthaster planci]